MTQQQMQQIDADSPMMVGAKTALLTGGATIIGALLGLAAGAWLAPVPEKKDGDETPPDRTKQAVYVSVGGVLGAALFGSATAGLLAANQVDAQQLPATGNVSNIGDARRRKTATP